MWFSSLIINGVLLDQQSMKATASYNSWRMRLLDTTSRRQHSLIGYTSPCIVYQHKLLLSFCKVTNEGSPEMNVVLRSTLSPGGSGVQVDIFGKNIHFSLCLGLLSTCKPSFRPRKQNFLILRWLCTCVEIINSAYVTRSVATAQFMRICCFLNMTLITNWNWMCVHSKEPLFFFRLHSFFSNFSLDCMLQCHPTS